MIAEAGGVPKLALLLGISHQAVYKWKRRRLPPIHRVRDLERITGIPRRELRPDLFGRE